MSIASATRKFLTWPCHDPESLFPIWSCLRRSRLDTMLPRMTPTSCWILMEHTLTIKGSRGETGPSTLGPQLLPVQALRHTLAHVPPAAQSAGETWRCKCDWDWIHIHAVRINSAFLQNNVSVCVRVSSLSQCNIHLEHIPFFFFSPCNILPENMKAEEL